MARRGDSGADIVDLMDGFWMKIFQSLEELRAIVAHDLMGDLPKP